MSAPQWIPTYSKEEVGLLFGIGLGIGIVIGFVIGLWV